MKVTISARGASLTACWLGLFSIVAGIAVWLLTNVAAGILTAVLCLIVLVGGCYLHRLGYLVELRGKELVITRGFFLKSILKIPVRYITGTTRFSTPLSRHLDTGVLAISSSGRLTVIVGLAAADMTHLRSLLTERQV